MQTETKKSWKEVDVFSPEFAANFQRGLERGAEEVAAWTPEDREREARRIFGTGNQKLDGKLAAFFGGK